MKLRTQLPLKSSNFKIDHKQSLFLIGSCFSNNVGAKLEQALFNVLQNPFGIIYNPISIFELLKRALDGRDIEIDELTQNEDLFFHFDFHSDFNGLDQAEVLINLNKALHETAEYLKHTDTLFITFGTAWVYEFKDKVVANCHKMSNQLFNKRMLSLDELKEAFIDFKSTLSKHNCSPEIVLTLSPVRHIKDGFEENQVSKSLLRYFINETNTAYFPSYELLLDDLRDYRFYEKDLVHPNELALDYIWTYFQDFYFADNTKQICKELVDLKNALHHRPRNEGSMSHKKFVQQLEQKLAAFEQKTGLKIVK